MIAILGVAGCGGGAGSITQSATSSVTICGGATGGANEIASPSGTVALENDHGTTDAAGVFRSHSDTLGTIVEVFLTDSRGGPLAGFEVAWCVQDHLLGLFVCDPTDRCPATFYQGDPTANGASSILLAHAEGDPSSYPRRSVTYDDSTLRIALSLLDRSEAPALSDPHLLQMAEHENLAVVSESYSWAIMMPRDVPAYLRKTFPDKTILGTVSSTYDGPPSKVAASATTMQRETAFFAVGQTGDGILAALLDRMAMKNWGRPLNSEQFVFVRSGSTKLGRVTGVFDVFPRSIDDHLGVNDSMAAAAEITTGFHPSFLSIATKPDWFKFAGTPGTTIEVTMRHAAVRGDLDLELFDPAGLSLAASATSADEERLIVPLAGSSPSGNYFIRIRRKTGSGCPNPYDLTLKKSLSPCGDPANIANIIPSPAGTLAVEFASGASDASGVFRSRSIDLGKDIAITLVDTSGFPLAGLEVAWSCHGGILGLFVNDALGNYPAAFYQGDPSRAGSDTILRSPSTVLRQPIGPRMISESFSSLDISMTLRTRAELGAQIAWNQLQKAEFENVAAASEHYVWSVRRIRELPGLMRWDFSGSTILVSMADGMSFPPSTVSTTGSPVTREAFTLDLAATTDAEMTNLIARMSLKNWGRAAAPDEIVFVRESRTRLGRLSGVFEIFPEAIDDAFEENDTLAAARLLKPGRTPSLVQISTDQDWFKFYGSPGATIEISIACRSARGDLDLELRDASGVLLSASNSAGDTDRITHSLDPVTGAGYYHLVVRRKSATGCPNPYDLEIIETLQPCANPASAGNDVASPTGTVAVDASSGFTDASGTYQAASSDLGKVLEIDVRDRAGFPIAGLEVSWACRNGVLGLFVLDPSGNYPSAFFQGDPYSIRDDTILRSPGKPSGSADMPRRLIITPQAMKIDLTLATRIELGSSIAANQLQKAEFENAAAVSETYAWSVRRARDLPSYLKWKHPTGMTLIAVGDGMALAPMAVTASNASVARETYAMAVIQETDAALLALLSRLSGKTWGRAFYPEEILFVRESDVDLGRLSGVVEIFPRAIDDAFEENDTMAAAKELTPGLHSSLMQISTDQDWFKCYGNRGATIEITLACRSTRGDLDLELRDSAGVLLAASNSTGDVDRIMFSVDPSSGAGYYHLVVKRKSAVGCPNPYDLRIVEMLPPCGDPANAGNDVPSPTGTVPVDLAQGVSDASGIFLTHSTDLGMDLEITLLDGSGAPVPGLEVAWACRGGLLGLYVHDPAGLRPPAFYQGNPFDMRSDTVLQSPARGAMVPPPPNRISITPTVIRITLTLRTAEELGDSISPGQLQKAEFENVAVASSNYAWSVHRVRDLPAYIRWKHPRATALLSAGVGMSLAPMAVTPTSGPVAQETYAMDVATASDADLAGILARMALRNWGQTLAPTEVVFLRESIMPLGRVTGVFEIFPRAIDDVFEENDTAGEAKVINAGNYSNVISIASDEDWYRFYGHIGSTFEVEIRYPAARGGLDLELRDPAGALIDTSANGSGVESVGVNELIPASATGYYLLKVSRAAPGCPIPYDLKVSSHVIPPATNQMLRIVLNWGADPVDLDSHLWIASPTGVQHVFFSNPGTLADQPYATLDIDRMTSDLIGRPETITVLPIQSTVYTYSVHHYNGFKTLSDSGATVHVYRGDRLVRSYSLPAAESYGWQSYWNVFTFDGATGSFSTINQFALSSPYNWSPGRLPAKPPSSEGRAMNPASGDPKGSP